MHQGRYSHVTDAGLERYIENNINSTNIQFDNFEIETEHITCITQIMRIIRVCIFKLSTSFNLLKKCFFAIAKPTFRRMYRGRKEGGLRGARRKGGSRPLATFVRSITEPYVFTLFIMMNLKADN